MANKTLHMSRIQEKLDTLAQASVNKIEREWPSRYRQLSFAQGFFALTLKLARHTYRTVSYLCADQRLLEHDWRWEYTLCLPALNRTLLDSLFNIVFMLEDLEPRSAWYHQSGWRETRLEYERYQKQYGNDPAWIPWLEDERTFLDIGAQNFEISLAEMAGPAQKATWPNPGRMQNHGVDPNKRPPDREFLAYLNDWFYREMSAEAHLSFSGLMKLGALLLRHDLPEEQSDQIVNEFYPKHRSIQVSRTAILLLCLISEIERHFGFGLTVRIVEIWDVLSESAPEAAEIFEKRYKPSWAIPRIGP
jgi:hypothetical protein